MHEHNSCEHTLKLCKVCDVVYCEQCKSQWRRNTYTYTYPNVWYNTCNNHLGTAVNAENVTNQITFKYTDSIPTPECCTP